MTEYLKYLPIILPSIFGYASALVCKVGSSSGVSVKFRPPSYIFSIVWIILYVLLGFSWYYAREQPIIDRNIVDAMYLLLNVFLVLWIVLYSCNGDKLNAIYILVFGIVFTLLAYTVGNITSKLLIVPLLGWLFLATLINIFEVENSSSLNS